MNLKYLRYKFFKPLNSWRNKYLKYITQEEARESNLYDEIAREISHYTGEPLDVIKQKHKSGPEQERNFKIFTDQHNLTKTDVESFYKDCCSYYLYELPLWNAERNRPRYLYFICSSYLRRNSYQKVLDFGGGAGDLCIELSKNKLDVTYCDIGEKLHGFAKWRFDKRGLPVKMVKGIDNVGSDTYDCIFSFDAFEHIKDLPPLVKKLASHIRPEGSLIFSGAFSGGTLHLEENEQYNAFNKLDALMESCNLKFQDKFAQFHFYKKK